MNIESQEMNFSLSLIKALFTNNPVSVSSPLYMSYVMLACCWFLEFVRCDDVLWNQVNQLLTARGNVDVKQCIISYCVCT